MATTFTLETRQQIESLLKKDVTIPKIAKILGVSAPTIYKEIRWHIPQQDYITKNYKAYSAVKAQLGLRSDEESNPATYKKVIEMVGKA